MCAQKAMELLLGSETSSYNSFVRERIDSVRDVKRRKSPLGKCQSSSTQIGETMTSPMLQHIPLASAYLCQDCDCVGNSAIQCPACASNALLGLACVLNRSDLEDEIPIGSFSFASAQASALAA
jgi:hypothetical protein